MVEAGLRFEGSYRRVDHTVVPSRNSLWGRSRGRNNAP